MTRREEILTRRDRTIILLETRCCWFPSPRSQFSTFGALPGEKPTEKVKCRSCNGDGKVNGRQGLEECKNCDGAGHYMVDGYTGKREREKRADGPLSGSERAQREKVTDGELARLSLQLASPSEVSSRSLEDETPELWERERDRHFRAGDYRALDLALEWLGGHNRLARQLVEWCYEFRVVQLGTAPQAVKRSAELAVDMLNVRMPETIRVPHWHLPGHAQDGYKARKAA